MTATEQSGACLCGATGYTTAVAHVEGTVCHCGICRRWSSGPYMGYSAKGAEVTLKGEADIGTYATSNFGERGFCKKCGSNLFWRMRDKSFYALSLGALVDGKDVRIENEIFIDDKPDYYSLGGDRPRLTGAEFAAMMSGSKE